MTAPSTMRAAVIRKFGSPDVLSITDVPRSSPAADEVLVRVIATTVNGGELFAREGRIALITGRAFPLRVGVDFAGEIVAIGENVSSHSIGDRVWGILPDDGFGAAAEYVAVPTRAISLAPRSLSPNTAVSALTGGVTALTALTDKADLKPGERLLVRGANGGVGSMVVQIGRHLGADITAVARTQSADFVTELGAHRVHDYTRGRELPEGPFDVIVDTVGRDLHRSRRLLARGGRMVAVALDARHIARSIGRVLVSLLHGRGRIRFFRGKPNSAVLTRLADLVDAGAIMPVVDSEFGLENISDAHRALESGGVRGKVVIRVAAERTTEM